MLLVRLLRTRKLYQFNFLELVLPDNPAHVFSIRSGLAAKTRRVSGNGERQPRGVNRLVAIKIGQGHFCRGNQPQILLEQHGRPRYVELSRANFLTVTVEKGKLS